MPSRIKILPLSLSNKIAAGEVVERPASVVKELIENSIDAGALRISVEVAAGGKQAIRVSDDGTGMSKDEVALALERHATSKISSESDLESIVSLGFRGEALPSMASVSKMAVESRSSEDPTGTKVVAEGGKIKAIEDVGRDTGTTVTVSRLFYNTPARRKFLKGTDTEMRHITRTVADHALAYPEIDFTLMHSRREIFRLLRGSNVNKRVEDIFGSSVMKRTVPLCLDGKGIAIEGFIGDPDIARSSRLHQAIFVNRRPITSKTLNHAIYAAYEGLLPKDSHPFFAVFFQIDPRYVDVNVHPAKREVRFSDDQKVHDALYECVRSALSTGGLIPQMDVPQVQEPRTSSPPVRETQTESSPVYEKQNRELFRSKLGEAPQEYLQSDLSPKKDLSSQFSLPLSSAEKVLRSSVSKPQEEEIYHTPSEHADVSLWQLHEKYIFARIKNGLIIVDQHVAHERIIYEETLKNLSEAPASAQQLLLPVTMELGIKEIEVLMEIIPLLEQMGFGMRDFGGRTVVIDAVPVDIMSSWGDGEVLKAIIDDIIQEGHPKSEYKEELAASYACHTSIKAGQRLSTGQMQTLIDRLFATENPFVCPHGRPIVVRMPIEELDKRFGR